MTTYLTSGQVANLIGFSPTTMPAYWRYSPEAIPAFEMRGDRRMWDFEVVFQWVQERKAIETYGLTTPEAAEYLGLASHHTFLTMMERTEEKLRRYRIGNTIHYFPQQLDEWAKRNLVPTWRLPGKKTS